MNAHTRTPRTRTSPTRLWPLLWPPINDHERDSSDPDDTGTDSPPADWSDWIDQGGES